MNETEKPQNNYGTIFETARLNASMRIRELDEAAEYAAVQSMVQILRPAVVASRVSPQSQVGTRSKINADS